MEKLKAVTMYKMIFGNNWKIQRAIDDYNQAREEWKP